ncbi:MAG: glycosyltransferase family 4 protein [Clostridia bacterium]|nr:glycosyltransferase family 4 protein [Clostridia bacterium]
MKIMIIAAAGLPIPAYKGGATETLVTELLKNIKNEDDLQIDVFSSCKKEADYTDGEGNIKYFYIQQNLFDKLYTQFFRALRLLFLKKINIPCAFARKLSKSIDLSKYDTIILEGNKNQVNVIRKNYKGKIVLHIHTAMTFTKNTPFAKQILSNCSFALGNSSYTASVIKEIDEAQSEKVIAYPNCIDTALFREGATESARAEIRRKYGISQDEYVYIYCGRVEPRKGVKELLQAFMQNGCNGRLMIVGASWFSSQTKTEYIQELEKISEPIRDKVIFTGYIPHNELPAYYAAADMCVVPSVCEEAACLVVLEAQASNTPVIASDKGGIPEFIYEGFSTTVRCDESFVSNLASEMEKRQENPPVIEAREDFEDFLRKNDTQQYYTNFKEIMKKVKLSDK